MRRRARRWPKVAIAIGAALILALDLAVVTLRDRATPVTHAAALDHFRHQVSTSTTDGVAATSTSADPSTTAATDPTTTLGRTSATSSATTATPSEVRPKNGVYTHVTSGGEEVPVINARRSYPEQTTSTIVRGAGCAWHLRVDLLKEHTDEYDLCSTPAGVTVTGIKISISWFFISASVDLHCDPPVHELTAGAAAAQTTSRCTGEAFGHDLVANLTVLPRPSEEITIGGTAVPAARVDWALVFTGQFQGTGTYQLWLDPVSGLFLKLVRKVDAQGQTPIGKQRYIEHSTMTLARLEPAT